MMMSRSQAGVASGSEWNLSRRTANSETLKSPLKRTVRVTHTHVGFVTVVLLLEFRT